MFNINAIINNINFIQSNRDGFIKSPLNIFKITIAIKIIVIYFCFIFLSGCVIIYLKGWGISPPLA
ncbi:hypothetical protein CF074_10860 [Clostridium botulinum]|nr:hypothetical protein [Clostridium botulinum]MBN3413209.1 hypothetical protein [Clostridium botulinum]